MQLEGTPLFREHALPTGHLSLDAHQDRGDQALMQQFGNMAES